MHDGHLEYLVAVIKFLNICVFKTDFEIHTEMSLVLTFPLFQKTRKSEIPDLVGLMRKKTLCCSISDIPVYSHCPTRIKQHGSGT